MSENTQALTRRDQMEVATAEEMLDKSTEMCKALMRMVDHAGLARSLGGNKPHLEVEAWQFMFQFFGLYPDVESAEYIRDDKGEIEAARAIVILRRAADDTACGRYYGECWRDEREWSKKRQDWFYKWKDAPKYQLLSMAQTRAIGKAGRSRYGYIARLAGFSGTPAEEMVERNGSGEKQGQAPTSKGNGGQRPTSDSNSTIYLTGNDYPCRKELDALGCRSKQVDGAWRRYVPADKVGQIRPIATKYNLEWHGLPDDAPADPPATGPDPETMTPEELAVEWQAMIDRWKLNDVAHAKLVEYFESCVRGEWTKEKVQAYAVANEKAFRERFNDWLKANDPSDVPF